MLSMVVLLPFSARRVCSITEPYFAEHIEGSIASLAAWRPLAPMHATTVGPLAWTAMHDMLLAPRSQHARTHETVQPLKG